MNCVYSNNGKIPHRKKQSRPHNLKNMIPTKCRKVKTHVHDFYFQNKEKTDNLFSTHLEMLKL